MNELQAIQKAIHSNSGTTYNYKANAQGAYVVSGGFCIPVLTLNYNYSWVAIG